MTNHHKIALWFILLISFFCLTGFASPPSQENQNIYHVKRAIDGDTILLSNGERVRYIGINTPETKHPSKPVEHFGKEAYEANKKLVEGKDIRLEFDVQQRDKYGRLLAYVYIGNVFVNAWLVENGYAHAVTYPPNVKYQKLFLKLEKESRESSRGLWK
ncbi:MAG: thermonuclease family protein [Candidatus Margulisbacteria bacterium]|nr:thermonuclease family protein [Candidatus Margulisiibacteriota bacterium]MBU1022340.1 thermonuclease family protein [Candidatus Margulisiibacteriota bacterium]MBU1728406.1 thermonuclease family protein [Candidatus Margulisiibacteriota bacterium]MBU1955237.1 thermonuclease family protein [Candidatus Margulisiibacteriota bacterium]